MHQINYVWMVLKTFFFDHRLMSQKLQHEDNFHDDFSFPLRPLQTARNFYRFFFVLKIEISFHNDLSIKLIDLGANGAQHSHNIWCAEMR